MRLRDGNIPLVMGLALVLVAGAVAFFYVNHKQQVERELTVMEEKKKAEMEARRLESERAANAVSLTDVERDRASETYDNRCAICHGMDGEGMVGPSLIDGEWLHGNTLPDVVRAISDGFPEQSMPPMKDVLARTEIRLLARYVLELDQN